MNNPFERVPDIEKIIKGLQDPGNTVDHEIEVTEKKTEISIYGLNQTPKRLTRIDFRDQLGMIDYQDGIVGEKYGNGAKSGTFLKGNPPDSDKLEEFNNLVDEIQRVVDKNTE